MKQTRRQSRELTAIYAVRDLEPALAEQVAEQRMHHYALGAQARDELSIAEALSAARASRAGVRQQLRLWGRAAADISGRPVTVHALERRSCE